MYIAYAMKTRITKRQSILCTDDNVNCLNACDTPIYSGGNPIGSVNYKLFCDLVAADKVLVIRL